MLLKLCRYRTLYSRNTVMKFLSVSVNSTELLASKIRNMFTIFLSPVKGNTPCYNKSDNRDASNNLTKMFPTIHKSFPFLS